MIRCCAYAVLVKCFLLLHCNNRCKITPGCWAMCTSPAWRVVWGPTCNMFLEPHLGNISWRRTIFKITHISQCTTGLLECFVLLPFVNRAVYPSLLRAGYCTSHPSGNSRPGNYHPDWLRWSLWLSSSTKTFVRFMLQCSRVRTVVPYTPIE